MRLPNPLCNATTPRSEKWHACWNTEGNPAPRERRVAATPDSVKRLLAMGFEVRVEPDAGTDAGYTDAAYAEAGAVVDT